jgi:hypothetical protein
MKRILGLVLGTMIVATGCADPVPPTTPTPAVPTVTDTFSDTLLVLGSNIHQFNVTTVGGVKVSLVSVEPGAVVSIGIGTPSLGSCTIYDSVKAVAGPTVQLSGTATVPGSYCVIIQDPGNLVEPAVYTINVLHS